MCQVRDTKKDLFEKSLIFLSITQLVKSLAYNFMYIQTYRKVPKITTLLTFGFSSLFLSLLSEGRSFLVAKTGIVHGPYEVTILISPQL